MAEVIDIQPAVDASNALRVVDGMRLKGLVQSSRTEKLDKLESYYRTTQHAHKLYDWDGHMDGVDPVPGVPGFDVPISQRRPSAQIDIARQIVKRLTSLTLGHGRWPDITVDGDPEAEDYVNELVRQSRLQARMVEARNLGGAEGSVALTFGFIDGKFRVSVLNAKHVFVLEWADRDELRPAAALESYCYTRLVYAGTEEKPKAKKFYYARLWTQTHEVVWDPIPEELAAAGGWARVVPSQSVRHNYGFCPVYWVQNSPASADVDGESDYEGLTGIFDQLSYLASQTTKGVIANVDPTLILKMDPSEGTTIRKGSNNALLVPGGGDYLTLPPDAVRTAKEWAAYLRREAEESSQTVFTDPEKLSGNAQSAAAMRILYMPMLAQCDVLRDQYGAGAMVVLLKDALAVCRKMAQSSAPEGPIRWTADGRRIQDRPVAKLPPRTREEDGPDGGEPVRIVEERTPGESSEITLSWPPYFPDTWADKKTAVEAASMAVAKKALISQETASRAIGPMFGVEDPEKESERMEAEADDLMARMQLGGPEPSMTTEELFGEGPAPREQIEGDG